jgi:hypothetical protein
MSGDADSAARRHAYDSSIKLPFDTNSRQNYRIRLQDLAAAIFLQPNFAAAFKICSLSRNRTSNHVPAPLLIVYEMTYIPRSTPKAPLFFSAIG